MLNQDAPSLCIASVLWGSMGCKLPSIRLFPDPTLVYLVLDLVQLCYLYGHSFRPVMMVVYMEHTSNHLGNNLAKEFLGPHSPTPLCQGKGDSVCGQQAVCYDVLAEYEQSTDYSVSDRRHF